MLGSMSKLHIEMILFFWVFFVVGGQNNHHASKFPQPLNCLVDI